MKRYNQTTEDRYFYDESWTVDVMAEHPCGEWVPAEVAQALYDALVVARKSLATYGEHPIIEDRIKSALSLADGDEQ
jgi:hypothetical protein